MTATEDQYPDLPDDWICCNCCECGCLLSGRVMRPKALDAKGRLRKGVPPVVAGSVGGRPACAGCREPREQKAWRDRGRETPRGWDDLFRALEGGNSE